MSTLRNVFPRLSKDDVGDCPLGESVQSANPATRFSAGGHPPDFNYIGLFDLRRMVRRPSRAVATALPVPVGYVVQLSA